VPAIERQPVKKIDADEVALLRLLGRWRDEATRAGHRITRVCVAFEAGRDGFWLAIFPCKRRERDRFAVLGLIKGHTPRP
jgi:hypothetical protein